MKSIVLMIALVTSSWAMAKNTRPWIDHGVKLKCWEVGNGSSPRTVCGYVHEYVKLIPSDKGPRDLNGDGKISAYERMIWQQEQNQGGH